MKTKDSFFSRWGAVVIIVALFFGSIIGQWFAQWAEFVETSAAHGETPQLSNFIPEFIAATLENWQSEFLQLAVQAVLIASFWQAKLFRADYEAGKDDVAEINEKLDRLLGENDARG